VLEGLEIFFAVFQPSHSTVSNFCYVVTFCCAKPTQSAATSNCVYRS